MSKFLMKGHFYESKHALGDWFLSEKLDGMLAYWDGGYSRGMLLDNVPFANLHKVKDTKQTATGLWSNGGKIIHAPEWFLDSMPAFMVIGELYVGKKQFQRTLSICRKYEPIDEEWKGITYNIFDCPNRSIWSERAIRVANGKYWCVPDMEDMARRYCVFNGAYEYFSDIVEFMVEQVESAIVRYVPHTSITSSADLWARRDAVIDADGEGIVLRDKMAVWKPDRSHTIMKMKGVKDCMVTVMETHEGKGRNKGRIGAVTVKCEDDGSECNGAVFRVNVRGDAGRTDNNWVGRHISITYRELTDAGIPKDGRMEL